MAKSPEVRRKLVSFDEGTWHALNLLSRESMKSFQELADEAFRDLLHKYKRSTSRVAGKRATRRWTCYVTEAASQTAPLGNWEAVGMCFQ